MIEAKVLQSFVWSSNCYEDAEFEFNAGDELFIVAVVDNSDMTSGKGFVCVFPLNEYSGYEGWECMTVDSKFIETVSQVKDLFDNKTIPYFEI